jgi:hypothetical protein
MTTRKDEYILVVQLQRGQATLERARDVIRAAENATGRAQESLCGCAAVLLAVALEQATTGCLAGGAANSVAADGAKFDETTEYELLKLCFRLRVLRLPELISSDRLALNPRNDHTVAIHELITVRNELLHLRDEPLTLKVSDDAVSEVDGLLKVDASIPIPKDPWDSITLRRVRRFEAAVAAYFREVIDSENGQLQASDLLLNTEHKTGSGEGRGSPYPRPSK